MGSHPDDIELFCGGVLLRAIDKGDIVGCVVCTNGEGQGNETARIDEQRKAWDFLKVVNGNLLGLKDGGLRHETLLVTKLDQVVSIFRPDVVFSHSEVDPHQDHEAVAKSIRSVNRNWNFNWVTYSPYDLRSTFIPNFFVGLDGYYERKKELLKIFQTQKDKWYFKEDVLVSRSMGSNIGKYVEPFRIEFAFIK